MQGFLLRTAITALGLALAAAVVPGITYDETVTLLVAALFLGFVNAVVRPLAILLTLPLTVVTLGFFLLIINGLMLSLVARLLDGFEVGGLLPAMLGSVIVGITSWLGSAFIGSGGRVERISVRRRR
jgi:putative membrane protein